MRKVLINSILAGVALAIIIPIVVVLSGFAQVNKVKNDVAGFFKPEQTVNITAYQVESKLKDLEELATCEYEYSNVRKIEKVKEIIPAIDWLDAKSEVEVNYTGVIKAGYQLDSIKVLSVDNEKQVITIKVPEAQVLDNYIDQKNVETKTKSHLFNPIKPDDMTRILAELETDELENAKAAGLLDQAKEKMISIIDNSLAEFDYVISYR